MSCASYRLTLLVTLVGAMSSVACGSDVNDSSRKGGGPGADTSMHETGTHVDPLVGAWNFNGRVANFVDLTITFKPDGTFNFVEHVSPATLPAGVVVDDACVTTDTYDGTYDETNSGGSSTLTWSFTEGVANEVTGCSNVPSNSAGTPMTVDAVASYIGQGDIPPTTVNYDVSPTTLLLTSSDTVHAGIARGPGTTFIKVPE